MSFYAGKEGKRKIEVERCENRKEEKGWGKGKRDGMRRVFSRAGGRQDWIKRRKEGGSFDARGKGEHQAAWKDGDKGI